MRSTHFKSLLPLLLAALICSFGSVQPALAQAPANPRPVPNQVQSPTSSELNNPTQPERQPDLAVDRDPIPSPDVLASAPETATNTTNTRGPAGQIQKGQNGVYTLHEDVDEVLLDCTVVDEKGHPILDLRKEDFRAFEDGAPQTVNSFVHQDLPVSMGILIDNSGSMRDKRTTVNAAAMKLLEQSNARDAAFVVNFNEHAYLDQAFTVDRVALHAGLAHFDSRGTTALYDAVAASADELARHAKQRKEVLLIITDGADNASHLALGEAIRRVQDLGGPVVYTIGLLYDADLREYQKAHDDLEALSAETGGLAYFPKSIGEVDEIASNVARDIRNQYTIGYHATKAASLGGYRTVRVDAHAPGYKRLIVRTRRGYFAHIGQGKLAQSAQDSSAKPDTPGRQ